MALKQRHRTAEIATKRSKEGLKLFLGRETHITSDMCFPTLKHNKFLLVFVYIFTGKTTCRIMLLVEQNSFLVNSSSHITSDMFFPGGGTHITSDMCFPGGGTHITRDMCFQGRETHITRDMCFLGRGTHITRDMCFPGGETHITRDIRFAGGGNTYH